MPENIPLKYCKRDRKLFVKSETREKVASLRRFNISQRAKLPGVPPGRKPDGEGVVARACSAARGAGMARALTACCVA